MNSYEQYANHLRNSSKVPLIGILAWYYVPDSAEIAHKDFVFLVESTDAPVKLPKTPKPADVFRRACNNAKILKARTGEKGIRYNYELRDAGYDDGFVWREMVEERVDAENHSLGFRIIAKATFSKEGVFTKFSPNIDHDDHAWQHYRTMADSIEAFIKARLLMLPAIAIREAARKGLEVHLMGTKVRPGGGVYFVSIEKSDKVDALAHVINSVDGASFHIMPLVDDEKQSAMLKEAFEDESVEETTRLISDITDLLKSDDMVTARKWVEIQTRYATQKAKLAEYQGILSDALSMASTQLEVANVQMLTLLEQTNDVS